MDTTPARHQAPGKPAPHAQPPEAVLEALNTNEKGLTPEQARERLEQYGRNTLPTAKSEGPLILLWRQINNPLIWVLIASGVVAMLVDWSGEGIKNGVVILAVVILNSIVGFVQEFKAGKAISALGQMVPEQVAVTRDGERLSVPAAELVPGDIVQLASGDRVPADLRLITVKNLQVEEAALTGESVPSAKKVQPVEEDAALGDRVCMAFSGTLVTYGTATGVVTATALDTELGRISKLLRETTSLQTPLTRALSTIGKYITAGVIAVAAVMLIIGVARTMDATDAGLWDALREVLIFAIALAVGAIPEGLPAIVTIALAIGVQRMARRQAVIRKLPAVETLGSTTIVCSDKTGTLTRNEMTVQRLWTPRGEYTVSGIGYEPNGALLQDDQQIDQLPEDVRQLLTAGALCNDASLRQEEGRWQITGDPTEAALLVVQQKLDTPPEKARKQFPRIDAIPFESEHQFMATLHREQGAAGLVIVKGAPEVVLRRCQNVDKDHVHHQVEALANQGMRVLAVAEKPMPDGREHLEPTDVEQGLELLGLLAMIDPPREEAIQAIRDCHAAGVVVKMITGDHKTTAAAIGRQLGVITEAGAVAGPQLEHMSDEQIDEVARNVNVFARVAPEHKLRLVRSLQRQGNVVAMTGDGVNDAPALKQADIGVAMGITGTAVSRQASDLVLTDDNFASIAAAIEEGRRVFDNLIKSLVFVLPTNLGLALILLCAVAFFPFDDAGELLLPLSPVQLLWINLVATVSLALPLAFEAREPDTMQRPPRDPNAPVLSPFVLVRTVLVALLMTAGAVGLFLWEYRLEIDRGLPPQIALAEAQTMAVTAIILLQCFYVLNCRSLRDSLLAVGVFSNPYIYLGIGVLLALQAAFVYLPPMNAIFGSAPLHFDAWVMATFVGMLILPFIAVEKFWRRRNRPAPANASSQAQSRTAGA